MSTLVHAESSANANAPNATSPVPERPTSSRTVEAAAMLLPGGGGIADAVGPAELEPGGLAEAGDALAAAHEQQRMLADRAAGAGR